MVSYSAASWVMDPQVSCSAVSVTGATHDPEHSETIGNDPIQLECEVAKWSLWR